MIAPHTVSLSDIKNKLAKGEVTPTEVVESCLGHMERTEPAIHACITICTDSARKEAAYLEQEAQNSQQKRVLPLWGVPIAIKDSICTKGIRTTCGSHMLEDFIPPYDAVVVEKLKAAGAIILAKTNMDEFAMGSGTEYSYFGPTMNPWDQSCVPGGSSGGSAASVAAGQVFAAIGTDTGGSIRQPAALCGCVGLLPTYGRVSRYGAVACASSFDQVGPMARTVEDCARIFSVIAGYDPKDAMSADKAVPSLESLLSACGRTDLSGMVLGLPMEYWNAPLAPEVEATCRKAVDALKELGATVKEVSLPHLPYSMATYQVLSAAESATNLARFDGMRFGLRVDVAGDLGATYTASRSYGFGEEVKRRILLGTYVLSAGSYDIYYTKAAKVRRLIQQDFARALTGCDALIAPATTGTAEKFGALQNDPVKARARDMLLCGTNLAGLPGISLPVGLGAESHLPVGLHIMGRAFAEETVFAIAGALEAALPKIQLPEIDV